MRKISLLPIRSLLVLLALASVAPAQTWVELAPSGTPPPAWSATNYDAANNRLIAYFEGNPAVNPAYSNQVWVLTNANGLGGTPVWTKLTPTGTPPFSNGAASVVYDEALNRLIVYGGCYANCSPAISNVFVLTNANGLGGTPVWQESSVTNPQARDGQSAVYDSTNNLMIAFGGSLAFFGTDKNDTRILTNANGLPGPSTWSQLATAGGLPDIREVHRAIYDQANNRMTIFGGVQAISTCCPYNIASYNDVWVLSNANGLVGTPTWAPESPGGSLPHPRAYHSAVYDTLNNRMIVFGGEYWDNAAQNWVQLGDLWQLTNANGLGGTPMWTQLSPTGTPPGPRAAHSASFDSAHQRMILSSGSDQFGPSNRVWVAVFTPPTTPPLISGLPAPGCTLWPPNHELVQVATVTATDVLGLSSFNVTATSSEPEDGLGDGDTAPDTVITGSGLAPRVVQLRAERSGTGPGRTYTITATATNVAGLISTSTATCVVPHDQANR